MNYEKKRKRYFYWDPINTVNRFLYCFGHHDFWRFHGFWKCYNCNLLDAIGDEEVEKLEKFLKDFKAQSASEK